MFRISYHRCFRAAALLLVIGACSNGFAEDINLVSEPGFESGTVAPWTVQPSRNEFVSPGDFIEGRKAFHVGHGPTPKTTEVFLNYQINAQPELVAGTSYVFSCNAKSNDGGGRIELYADFDTGTNANHKKSWALSNAAGGIGNWQKYEFKFRIPNAATNMKIGCRFVNTTGRNWLDWAHLYPYKNMIANGDFEGDGFWTLTQAAKNTVHRHFGSRSLRVTGDLRSSRRATQVVDLTRFVDRPDLPMYTISAHLKTNVIESAVAPPQPMGCNSSDFDEELDPVVGSGAQIQIGCYDGNNLIRQLYFPYFESNCTKFIQQKVSFLVPRGTDRLAVSMVVFNSKTHAYFDNVRLTHSQVPGGQYIGEVGCTASVVQAPEPGTYVIPTGPTTNEIADSITRTADIAESDYGKIVWLPRGDYLVEKIIPKSRTHLQMHHDARLLRDPTGLDNYRGSIFRSDDIEIFRRVSDVIIEGGRYAQAASSGNNNLGNIASVYGDRIVFRNHFIPEWAQLSRHDTVGNQMVESPNSDIAVSFLGNDIYVYHNTVVGPAGNLGNGTGPGQGGFDALHYFGGSRAHFMGNQTFAGDDGIGLYTGTIPYFVANCATGRKRLFIYNRNIADVEIYNNRLSSNTGRAVSLGLARPRSNESDLTATVKNVRARNVVGRLGGQAAAIGIICSTRKPMEILPGQTCPTEVQAANDPAIFPFREPQVKNIQFARMLLTVDVGNPFNIRPVQHAMRIYSEDAGSVRNVLFNAITIWTINSTGRVWPPADRPIDLLQIRRAGLICEHFATDPATGENVSTGFTAVKISHRNYGIRIKNCRFFDNTGSFQRSFDIDSTEQMNNSSSDVSNVFDGNQFPSGLPGSWQVIRNGIH